MLIARKRSIDEDAVHRDSLDQLFISHVDDPLHLPDEMSVNRLWERLKYILRAAHACDIYQKDENAWSEVARLVLRTAVWDYAIGREEQQRADLEIADIQSQTIDRQYLPTFQLSPGYCDRRTDIAVAFSPEHEDYAPVRRRLLQAGLKLSHMKDVYTSTVALAHPVEIKAANGD